MDLSTIKLDNILKQEIMPRKNTHANEDYIPIAN